MNTKYILVPDAGLLDWGRQAMLYRLEDDTDLLAPKYVKICTGPAYELSQLTRQLNLTDQPGEGENPVPLSQVDPLAEMEVDNLDRIIHDTKPHSDINEISPEELADVRVRDTPARDEHIPTVAQWTRLTDRVDAFLVTPGETIKAQNLKAWLSHRDSKDTIRIRLTNGEIQFRAEKADQ